MSEQPLDAAGRRRLPAPLPQFDAGRGPRRGIRYTPAPIEESIAVEGWRCSSVGSPLEVAISIAPRCRSRVARLVDRSADSRSCPIVGARGTAVDTSRADA
jgi:hypothetical protein